MVRTLILWLGAVTVCSSVTGCGGAPASRRHGPPSSPAGYWERCDRDPSGGPADVTRCVELRGQAGAPLTDREPISAACAAHDPIACRVRGRLIAAGALATEPDDLRFGFLQAGCDHSDPASCEALGEIFLRDDALDSAHAAFQRGCEYGSTSACLQLGQLLQRGGGCRRNRKMAVRLFEQTCQRGMSRGCALAADMYRQGWGVAFSPTRAADLYQQACNQDNPRACRKLADLYRAGIGVTRSDRTADQLLARACAMGSANACDDLRLEQEKAERERAQPAATPAGLEGDSLIAPTTSAD